MFSIDLNFIKKFKEERAELKTIQKAILIRSTLSKKKTEEHLERLLDKYGQVIRVLYKQNDDYQGAFILAEDWNNYELQTADNQALGCWIDNNKIKVSSSDLVINKETWSWLVCLAYLKAKPKESPNHFFLKRLMELYFKNYFGGWEIRKELSAKVFTENIRYDLCLQKEKKLIIGEVGGVQVWKVMATLEQGFDVIVMPHWTKEKKYPFINYQNNYRLFWFHFNK